MVPGFIFLTDVGYGTVAVQHKRSLCHMICMRGQNSTAGSYWRLQSENSSVGVKHAKLKHIFSMSFLFPHV